MSLGIQLGVARWQGGGNFKVKNSSFTVASICSLKAWLYLLMKTFPPYIWDPLTSDIIVGYVDGFLGDCVENCSVQKHHNCAKILCIVILGTIILQTPQSHTQRHTLDVTHSTSHTRRHTLNITH